MAKTASLTSGLVAKKGQAAPAALQGQQATGLQDKEIETTTNYYKALTVKLDRDRYSQLKNLGLKLDKKSQEIFVEALDHYMTSLEQH
jgi:hypothetical protein